MKRSIFVMTAILAAVLLPWTPAAAQADSGPNGFAVGGGDASLAFEGAGAVHFAFSAHQTAPTPDIPSPGKGYVALTFENFGKVDGPVLCLAVAANSAAIVFIVKHTTNPAVFYPGEEIAVLVQDNRNTGVPDGIDFDVEHSPTLACDDGQVNFIPPPDVTKGNIVVHDPVLGLFPCPAMTDNTTYKIGSGCNLFTNTGTATSPTWTLMQ
jgi:hypothetical protein